jgi:feruloyl esterase
MTSAMLACYPEVFAAGAIIAGLPYGTAGTVQQAFESMFQCPTRSAREWGDLVRAAASQYQGPWPRISIWHGQADATVIPPNAGEILKQWTDVHGLKNAPSFEERIDGHPRKIWLDQAGDEVVEAYDVVGMAHGTPLATGASERQCGAAGPFFLEAGISSSYHIAKFFGLTAAGPRAIQAGPNNDRIETVRQPVQRAVLELPPTVAAETLRDGSKAEPPLRFDVGAVITKAMQAAGLMKGDDRSGA